MTEEPKLDPIGITLLSIFFILLSYAGYLSYKSIDWTVLERMEAQQLILPTQIPESASTSATKTITPTATNAPPTAKD